MVVNLNCEDVSTTNKSSQVFGDIEQVGAGSIDVAVGFVGTDVMRGWRAQNIGAIHFVPVKISHERVVVANAQEEVLNNGRIIEMERNSNKDRGVVTLHVEQFRRVIVVTITDPGRPAEPGAVIEEGIGPVGRRLRSPLEVGAI